VPAQAAAPSGAIFTTLADGSAVNFNNYASKGDVYLDGGPGPGAPATAAGLDDGVYVFQVTDPSGKTLLSQDPAVCRLVRVIDGLFTVIVSPCSHATGVDVDHGAETVQLMPYADTPNPGGEYKVWITSVSDFVTGCLALGVPTDQAVNVADCGISGGNKHGFVGGASKTDNFKVGEHVPVEIDTRFRGPDGNWIDGLAAVWTDTHGATNRKWSQFAPSLMAFHEAHVEAVEKGTHHITVADQPGCTIGAVTVDGRAAGFGARTVEVTVRNTNKALTLRVDVDCT